MTIFAPEMIEKAKAVKTAEELLALAKENGIEMTGEEAKAYFEQLNPKSGELSDDELDNVAGGGCGNDEKVYDGAARTAKDLCVCGERWVHIWDRDGFIMVCDSCNRIRARGSSANDMKQYLLYV